MGVKSSSWPFLRVLHAPGLMGLDKRSDRRAGSDRVPPGRLFFARRSSLSNNCTPTVLRQSSVFQELSLSAGMGYYFFPIGKESTPPGIYEPTAYSSR